MTDPSRDDGLVDLLGLAALRTCGLFGLADFFGLFGQSDNDLTAAIVQIANVVTRTTE